MSDQEYRPRATVSEKFSLGPISRLALAEYFYSFSGGIITEGELPGLVLDIDDYRIEIGSPRRIGAPSLRPSPQLTNENFGEFFPGLSDPPFCLQRSAFPALDHPGGAVSLATWQGPDLPADKNGPALPADTIIVRIHGERGMDRIEQVERLILRPMILWLRALTQQSWLGRSIEQVSGGLHFVIPIAEDGTTFGNPFPIVRNATCPPDTRALNEELWNTALEMAP